MCECDLEIKRNCVCVWLFAYVRFYVCKRKCVLAAITISGKCSSQKGNKS